MCPTAAEVNAYARVYVQVDLLIDETNFASYLDDNGAKITDVRNIKPHMFAKLYRLTTEPGFIQKNKFYRLDANVNPMMGQDWFQRGLLRPDLVGACMHAFNLFNLTIHTSAH
jgi:hypothetical protein